MLVVTATAFLIAALVSPGLVAAESCKFTLQKDLNPQKEPLVLAIRKTDIRDEDEDVGEDEEEVDTLYIANPRVVNGNTGVLKLQETEKMMIACTGNGNSINGNGQETSYLECHGGKLNMDGVPATVESTSCKKSFAKSWLKETKDTCGSGDNTGKMLQVGFKLKDKSWFPLVDVCHNVEQGSTLYVRHTIVGSSISGAEQVSDRKGFTKGPKSLYKGISPGDVFSQKGQKSAFSKILGPSACGNYITDKVFLARGHLAPDADFIFNSEQMATYYFVNAAPQWQDFNAGNWLVIENAMRDLAAKEELDLEIYTGTYGVLELPDSTNHKKELFLAPEAKMVPVPKLFWKMVQHPVTKACTIAIGHNNIYLQQPPQTICPEKTPDGWPALKDLSKGYVYYCDYQGFAQTVTYAPDLGCKDLYEFPEL